MLLIRDGKKLSFTFEELAGKIATMVYLFNSEWPFTGGKSSLLAKHG
jgi:hypothetical protein